MRKKIRFMIAAFAALIMIILLSNIHNGIISKPPEQIQLVISAVNPITLEEIQERFPHITIEDREKKIIRMKPEDLMQTVSDLRTIPSILQMSFLPGMPTFSWSAYGQGLWNLIEKYTQGDFGTIIGSHLRATPLTEQLPSMIITTFSYLIPGLVIGVLFGFLFAVFASWRPKIGSLLDRIHRGLLILPDFVVIVLLQLIVVYITRWAERRIILIAQIGTESPYLLPLLTIMIFPAVLVYGTIRSAIKRECSEPYILTASAKGLSVREVLIRHVLRNVMEDFFSVLPRATTAAVTSMVIAEATCMIFGLGGYVVSKYFNSVDTLTITSLILALFTIIMHLIYFLLRKKLIVSTKEAHVQ